MAREIITRCGYRCDLCLAYRENIEKDDKRELLSKGWNKIFGIELSPDEIYCDGCLSCHDNTKLIDGNCPVRPCVISKSIENCSQCDEFPCDILGGRLVKYDEWEERLDFKITRSDRKNFIKPYENYDRLNALMEKQGTHSRMYNKEIEPTFDDMTKFIGDKNITTMWNDFHEYIDEAYDFSSTIRYGGKSYGWVINYRRGSKSMLSIHAERNAFTVLFVFGSKELDAIKEVEERISPVIIKYIDTTKKYHDGKWIWLRVTAESNISDYKELLSIKRRPNLS